MFQLVLRQRFPQPLPFPLFIMGKLFDLRVFDLRAHFQERNYRISREVVVLDRRPIFRQTYHRILKYAM
jgi:hypothetical protein